MSWLAVLDLNPISSSVSPRVKGTMLHHLISVHVVLQMIKILFVSESNWTLYLVHHFSWQ